MTSVLNHRRINKAFSLIFHLDAELLGIIYLYRSMSVCLRCCSQRSLGVLIGIKWMPAKGALVSILNTFMAGFSVTVLPEQGTDEITRK